MRTHHGRRGMILLLVLWVMVVLTILGASYFHLTTMQLETSQNDLAKFEAFLLAEGALQLAMSQLATDSLAGTIDLTGDWSGAGKLFESATLGDGMFQLYTDDVYSEEGGTLYGLRDEASKINLNTATLEMLRELPNMTGAMAAAIIDWRDPDSEALNGGAENEYYNGQTPSYDARNAPFETNAELLQVRGFTAEILYGEDANQDGVLQTAEDDGADNDPPDNGDGQLDRGLLPYITVYSYDRNVNTDGLNRLNINSAEESALRERLEGKVDSGIIDKIIKFRTGKKLESPADLLSAEAGVASATADGAANQPTPTPTPSTAGGATEGAEEETGAPVTTEQLKSIYDDLTATDEEKQIGRVNLNTAPRETLLCLPGLNENLVDAILSQREGETGTFESAADLLTLSGMDVETFKELEPWVTVRSSVFEAKAIGYFPKREAYSAILAVIDRGETGSKFLHYRILR